MLDMKKGISGIRNRTKVPKLETDSPTEKAKNMEKRSEN
jgi:hypothetical protein